MNYRWVVMGIGVIIMGIYLFLFLKLPLSWLVSIIGFIILFIGISVKKRDTYARGQPPIKSHL